MKHVIRAVGETAFVVAFLGCLLLACAMLVSLALTSMAAALLLVAGVAAWCTLSYWIVRLVEWLDAPD